MTAVVYVHTPFRCLCLSRWPDRWPRVSRCVCGMVWCKSWYQSTPTTPVTMPMLSRGAVFGCRRNCATVPAETRGTAVGPRSLQQVGGLACVATPALRNVRSCQQQHQQRQLDILRISSATSPEGKHATRGRRQKCQSRNGEIIHALLDDCVCLRVGPGGMDGWMDGMGWDGWRREARGTTTTSWQHV